jgi:hypothetical protein
VVGTLRKPDLWESTAVPELRQQAAAAAEAILALAAAGLPTGGPGRPGRDSLI